jgi:hypothetical protein
LWDCTATTSQMHPFDAAYENVLLARSPSKRKISWFLFCDRYNCRYLLRYNRWASYKFICSGDLFRRAYSKFYLLRYPYPSSTFPVWVTRWCHKRQVIPFSTLCHRHSSAMIVHNQVHPFMLVSLHPRIWMWLTFIETVCLWLGCYLTSDSIPLFIEMPPFLEKKVLWPYCFYL